MKTNIVLILISLIALNLNAQISIIGGKTIKGSKNIVSIEQNISNFSKLRISGDIEVVMKDSLSDKIIITGDDNLIPYIKINVNNNGTLKIKNPAKYKLTTSTAEKIKVFIPVKRIESINLSGSSKLSTNSLVSQGNFSLRIRGSGNIETTVNTNELHCKISGTGSINLKGNSDISNFQIRGSGKINAFQLVCPLVTAKMSGSGILNLQKKSDLKLIKRGGGSVAQN